MTDTSFTRTALDNYFRRRSEADNIRARLGRIGAGGLKEIEVTGRPERVYIRILSESNQEISVTDAINTSVARTFDLLVSVHQLPNGDREIRNIDVSTTPLISGGTSPGQSVGPHSHGIGTGNEVWVGGRQILPGLVKRGPGLSVLLDPFFIYLDAVLTYVGGDSLDLTPYGPSSPGSWRWVRINLSSTNTLIAAAGPEYSDTTPLQESELASILLEGIPLAGYKAKYGETELGNEYRFTDLRPWVSGVGWTAAGILALGGGGGSSIGPSESSWMGL